MESKRQSTCLTVQGDPVRDLRTITSEICYIRERANQVVLESAIQIGLRLQEAKAQLPHGEWGAWLKEQVHFSQSTATNLMKLAEEYGTGQVSLFAKTANSQTLANLPYTKALKLLALPAEERDEFAEEHNIRAMSTRELEKAIRERDEARRARKEAEERAERAEASAAAVRHAEAQVEAEKQRAAAAEQTAAELKTQMAELSGQLDRAQSDAQAAREQAQQMKDNPEIPAEMLASLKAEAEQTARSAAEAEAKAANEQALADLRHRLETAEAQKSQAEQAAQEAAARAESIRKQSAQSNPDVIRFKAQFERVQRELQQLRALLNAIRASDEDTADKLTRAMEALVRQYGGNA